MDWQEFAWATRFSSEETAKRLAARSLPGSISTVAARVALVALGDTAHGQKDYDGQVRTTGKSF